MATRFPGSPHCSSYPRIEYAACPLIFYASCRSGRQVFPLIRASHYRSCRPLVALNQQGCARADVWARCLIRDKHRSNALVGKKFADEYMRHAPIDNMDAMHGPQRFKCCLSLGDHSALDYALRNEFARLRPGEFREQLPICRLDAGYITEINQLICAQRARN